MSSLVFYDLRDRKQTRIDLAHSDLRYLIFVLVRAIVLSESPKKILHSRASTRKDLSRAVLPFPKFLAGKQTANKVLRAFGFHYTRRQSWLNVILENVTTAMASGVNYSLGGIRRAVPTSDYSRLALLCDGSEKKNIL